MERHNFYQTDEDGPNDYLTDLINSGALAGPAAGIARQLIDKGIDSLSDRQWLAFRTGMEPYFVEECVRDANNIPWSEMADAVDNGGYCGYCSHMRDKLFRE